jgi:TonB family protein
MRLLRGLIVLSLLCGASASSSAQEAQGRKQDEAEEVFRVSEVSQRAEFKSRPEPLYTPEARDAGIEGVIRLRMVLSDSGKVTNIAVMRGLPGGLNEQAIKAARKIKFKPAIKDGKKVSQYVTIDYNFTIYEKHEKQN